MQRIRKIQCQIRSDRIRIIDKIILMKRFNEWYVLLNYFFKYPNINRSKQAFYTAKGLYFEMTLKFNLYRLEPEEFVLLYSINRYLASNTFILHKWYRGFVIIHLEIRIPPTNDPTLFLLCSLKSKIVPVRFPQFVYVFTFCRNRINQPWIYLYGKYSFLFRNVSNRINRNLTMKIFQALRHVAEQ